MLEQLGGRKLIAGLLVTAVGVAVTLIKGDVPANLQQLLEVVYGAFVVGNITNHGTAMLKGKAELSIKPPEPESNKNLEQGVVLIQDLLQLIIRRTGIDKMQDGGSPK